MASLHLRSFSRVGISFKERWGVPQFLTILANDWTIIRGFELFVRPHPTVFVRRSMRCGDLPSEKLRPEDVEGMLCEHSVVSEETGLTSGSGMQGTGAEEMASMLMDTSERSSGGGVVRHSQDTDGGDEEADIDASAYLAGGALDKTRCHNNIVVQIDPVLEAVSSPSTRSKPGSSAAAANSVGASANSIGTQEMGRVANGRNGVRPGGDNPVMAGHPGGCCGRRGRRRRDSEERGDSA